MINNDIMKCGGFSNTEVNEEHIDIINSKRDEIENILIKKGRNGKIEHFELLELQQQVVAGMNYIFKIKLQEKGDEVIHVRIYKNLCNEISIHSIE
tara:strand:- start:669 stop:956 length:288 start_codon:yes stop_codon:yes gene_type:complete